MIKAAMISVFAISLLNLLHAGRSSASLSSQLPNRSKILDMHCHVAGIGAGGSGAFLSEKMCNSWKYRIYLKASGV
jgi:hypothetical protein